MDMDDEFLHLCIRDERYSHRSNSHGTTNDNEGYNEPPSQSAVFYNFPKVHQTQRQFAAPNSFPNAFNCITNVCQPQWQFDASYDISNAFEPQDIIGAPYNNPTVYQPLGQIAAPGNCTNVSEPQSLSDSDVSDILQQFLSEFGAPSDDANVFHLQLQDGAPYDFPNNYQPQRQFDASYDISNGFERQDQIGVHCNNPTVYQPLGQIAATGNCRNVPEPQSNAANCAKVFDRQSLPYLKEIYGPVFEDCDEVRRKIREYTSMYFLNVAKFARAINISRKGLYPFLRQKGFNSGAANIVYPAAYYYFEIMRLFYREEKSRHRLQSEKHYPDGYELRRGSDKARRKF